VRPLTRQAAEALATRGYIDVADPLAGECEALFWRHTADLEGLDARLASILSARTPPPACLVNPGPGRRAWLPVQHLRLKSDSSTPYHHSAADIVSYARHVSAKQLLEASEDLHVELISLPPAGDDYAAFVTTNGNHRALVFRLLEVPIIPAWVSPCISWSPASTSRTTGAVLRHLETDQVIVRSRDDLWGDVFATDSAVPWIMPASIWSAPGAVRRFEASYGPITDRRIGWLRRRLTIAARLLTG